MSPLDKMWVSFVAIGLMAVAAVLITVARTKLSGFWKGLVSITAFLALVVGTILAIISVA